MSRLRSPWKAVTALALALALACGGGGDDGGPTGPAPSDRSEPEISSITVSPSNAELGQLGATQDFQAIARDADGNEISGVSFDWSSSVSSVATVDGQGVATARDNGAATIEAEAEGVAGTASLTVRAGELAWEDLGVGLINTCGVTTHGALYCWGDNAHGQLGRPPSPNAASPVKIESDRFFEHVYVGGGHVCALSFSDVAYCWGAGGFGERGDGEPSDVQATPLGVRDVASLEALATGGNHTCGVSEDGSAYCWGRNARGKLGDGSTDDRSTPVQVEGDLTFVQISAGPASLDNHTCGVTASETAHCWGPNGAGELGDRTTTERHTPTAVDTDLSFQEIHAGGAHTCGLTGDGSAFCWGDNAFGQLGDGTTEGRRAPVEVAGGRTFEELGVGRNFGCGLTAAAAIHCWGINSNGQLGDGTDQTRTSPVRVSGGLEFVRLEVGTRHACGLTPEGAAYCWGRNSEGQLADGTFRNRNEPVRVPDPGTG